MVEFGGRIFFDDPELVNSGRKQVEGHFGDPCPAIGGCGADVGAVGGGGEYMLLAGGVKLGCGVSEGGKELLRY